MSVSYIEDFKEHYTVEYTWVVKDFKRSKVFTLANVMTSTIAGKRYDIQRATFKSHNENYLWSVHLIGFDCCSTSDDYWELHHYNIYEKGYYYVEVRCTNLTKTFHEKKIEILISAGENYNVYLNRPYFNSEENCKEIKLFEASKSDQLVNDKGDLTIVFRITELFSIATHSPHLHKLSCGYEKLLKSGDFSDFKIIIGEKEFPVHKNILSARSDYFSAMFRHDTVEQTNNMVKLTDVRPEVMSEVLQYIYCGTINITEESVYDFLTFADVYQMKDLQKMCEETIKKRLKTNNVGDCIVFAEQHNNNFLKEAAADFVTKHATEFKADGMNELKTTLTMISSPFMANLVYKLLLKIKD